MEKPSVRMKSDRVFVCFEQGFNRDWRNDLKYYLYGFEEICILWWEEKF